MRVKDVFQRDIGRSIPEDFRVNSDDALLEEIDEDVVTDHILDQIEAVFESYEESIHTLIGRAAVESVLLLPVRASSPAAKK
jgi:hypothetical protein